MRLAWPGAFLLLCLALVPAAAADPGSADSCEGPVDTSCCALGSSAGCQVWCGLYVGAPDGRWVCVGVEPLPPGLCHHAPKLCVTGIDVRP